MGEASGPDARNVGAGTDGSGLSSCNAASMRWMLSELDRKSDRVISLFQLAQTAIELPGNLFAGDRSQDSLNVHVAVVNEQLGAFLTAGRGCSRDASACEVGLHRLRSEPRRAGFSLRLHCALLPLLRILDVAGQ